MDIHNQTAFPGSEDRVHTPTFLHPRALVVTGSEEDGYQARGIFHPLIASDKVRQCHKIGLNAQGLSLHAPYGVFEALDPEINIVALHTTDTGRIEAHGPFRDIESAYDYFPDHSSPHDTIVTVFELQANEGEVAA